MKIIFTSLLCSVMAITDPIRTRTKVISAQLKSKIFNGEPATIEKHTYIASLQLNGSHICGSGLFREGFLVTTSMCGWYIGQGIKDKFQRATAVIGNSNLKKGQRIDILKITYKSYCSNEGSTSSYKDDDVAVIMLADDVDYTDLQILDLYVDSINIHYGNFDAEVCGWGSVTKIDESNHEIGNAEHAENLHCMPVIIRSRTFCGANIKNGDFKRRLVCGQADRISPRRITALGDIGSPLTKNIVVSGRPGKYIIGITLHRFMSEAVTILRFIKFRYIRDQIKDMVTELQSHTTTNAGCSDSSTKDSEDKPNKRPKLL